MVGKYYLHEMQELMKPLKVLSASAGSGKTFSLVQAYLELTIGPNVSPKNFSKIIAMTFTNKAAWEMKARIIEALDFLAFPNRDSVKETQKALNLMSVTEKTLKLTPAEIERKSKKALSQILHHYEDFHVMTIDKFSLRLIRTFSRDLDLSDDFEVVLDQRELLEQVVDELLSKIGKPGEEQVTKLTVDYAKSNLAEGDKWNFRSNLISFAKVLTVESDQEYIDKLLKKSFTSDQYESIKNEIGELNTRYSKKAFELYEYFQSLNSSSDDYPSKTKGLYGWLDKLNNLSLKEYKPINKTALKTISGENVNEKHIIDAGLITKVEAFLKFESNCLDRYYLLNKLRKNFYNLALLKHIAHELNLFKERQNVIGIYEFSRKISELLKKEIAPYIYERLGTRFQHYLLDEFQDTSRLQWLNLIPLVHDSIAGGNRNLIVGDPKQAIYRFRNGLVEQFVSLPTIYNPEKDQELALTSAFFNKMGEKSPLEENYRSKQNVVDFNNTFFKYTLGQLPERFYEYYEDIHQNPKGGSGGYVAFETYDKTSVDSTTELIEDDFLLKTVRKCLQDGYKCGDICVLARTKKAGNHWAKVLSRTEEQFKVVSTDSLNVNSDKTVRFFIDYFELRKNIVNSTAQIKFASSFFQIKNEDPLVKLESYWKKRVGDLDFEKFVIDNFGSEETLFLDYENMYDLGQKFSHLISVNELRNPYLHHFMEILQQYDLRFGPDLRGFLDHWKTKASGETVQMPENDDAIKLMTIHKSKGLEFPIVILPNLEWEIKPSRSEQFLQTDEKEIFHSKLSKENVPNYMLNAYNDEYEQQLLDAFNLLYVSMTRAEDRIYGLLNAKESEKSNEYYSKLSQPMMMALNAMPIEFFTKKDDEIFALGGEEKKSNIGQKKQSGFKPADVSDFLWFPEMSLKDQNALEEEGLSEEQRFGNQLHLILAKVNNLDDLENTVQEAIKNDLIEKEFITEIVKTSKSMLNLPEYKQLLTKAKKILSEQDILLNESQTHRPDKLLFFDDGLTVIDFKSGNPQKKHEKQVKNYLTSLDSMGFKNTKGYLLYAKNISMIEVV